MRFLTPVMVVSLAVAFGCGHTRSVSDADKAAADQDGHKHVARKHRDVATGEEKTKPKAGEAERTEQGVPLATSPAGLLKPGAEKKIQEKLASDGLLKSDKRGELDEPTRAALRRFQDAHDLPATGLPDHETMRRLGLDPDDLFSAKSDNGSADRR